MRLWLLSEIIKDPSHILNKFTSCRVFLITVILLMHSGAYPFSHLNCQPQIILPLVMAECGILILKDKLLIQLTNQERTFLLFKSTGLKLSDYFFSR